MSFRVSSFPQALAGKRSPLRRKQHLPTSVRSSQRLTGRYSYIAGFTRKSCRRGKSPNTFVTSSFGLPFRSRGECIWQVVNPEGSHDQPVRKVLPAPKHAHRGCPLTEYPTQPRPSPYPRTRYAGYRAGNILARASEHLHDKRVSRERVVVEHL